MKIDDLFNATDTNDRDFPVELLDKIHAKRKEDFERFKKYILDSVIEIEKEVVKGRVSIGKIKIALGVI